MTPKASLSGRIGLSGSWRISTATLAWLSVTSLAAESQLAATSAIEELRRGLTLTDTEKTALGDVTDRSTQWRESAFYLLLRRVSQLPALSPEDLHSLDAPAYRSLLDEPQRYRARAMRRRVRIYRVLKMSPGRGHADLGYSPAWPKERPVWQIYCAGAKASDAGDEPMVVFSTVEPAGLGRPDKVTMQGEHMFSRGPTMDVVCVFYKLLQDADHGSGRRRNYPLLLAWQMFDRSEGAQDAVRPGMWAAIAGIGALAVGYYCLRRHVRRLRRPATVETAAGRASRPAREGPDAGDEQAAGTVDPLLKEAAEQYTRERNHGD